MKKNNILKIVKLIVVLILIVGLIVYLFPIMKNLATYEGQIQFKEKVKNYGVYGFLLLFMLQFAQILLVILPGEPLEVLSGMCYGAVGGTIFLLFSFAVTTTIIVMLVRKYGKKFIYQNFSKEKIDRIENSKIFQNPKNIEYILIILFAIIGPPKDFLVYLGALLPIKTSRFIFIATFARLPSIISSTIVGKYFLQGNWKTGAVIYGITFIITIGTLLIVNLFDKDKVTQKALDELK